MTKLKIRSIYGASSNSNCSSSTDISTARPEPVALRLPLRGSSRDIAFWKPGIGNISPYIFRVIGPTPRVSSSSKWAIRFVRSGPQSSAPYRTLISLFGEKPAAAFAVCRETLVDASIFRETITNNGSQRPLARLAHWFCEMYFRSNQVGLLRRDTMSLPLNQAQIGETLGMSLVSVNRTLRQIRRSAAADFGDGTLIVKDWMKLSSIGDFDPAYLHATVQPRR
jgi:Crp-like helix-turn-helix domain